MRKSVRYGAVGVAAVAAAAFAALPAGAASADGAPPVHPVHHAAVEHHSHHEAKHEEAPKPPPTGKIIVCNHSGYLFNVYADGPSIREDDLGGSFDECTDWYPVRTGGYDVGFGLKLATSQRVIIQARFKRDGHVYYKSFNNEGIVKSNVGEHETLRIDLFIPQG